MQTWIVWNNTFEGKFFCGGFTTKELAENYRLSLMNEEQRRYEQDKLEFSLEAWWSDIEALSKDVLIKDTLTVEEYTLDPPFVK